MEKPRTEGNRPIFDSYLRLRSSPALSRSPLRFSLENLLHMQYTSGGGVLRRGRAVNNFNTILIVDDDPAMREILSGLLRLVSDPSGRDRRGSSPKRAESDRGSFY